MKPPFLGLRTAIYKVGDLDKAKEWYAKAFGQKPYFDQPYYVGFNIGGFEFGLLPESSTVKEKKDSVLTYWGVEDAVAQYKRLLSQGAKAHEPVQNVGGNVVVASVFDPWGNILGIIYNPEFKPEGEKG